MDNPELVNPIIERCMKMVSEIRQDWTTYDIHVHPTEFFFNSCDYSEDEQIKDIFLRTKGGYAAPSLEGLEKELKKCGKDASEAASPRIAKMFIQKTYRFTGSRYFYDYFNLSGIDKGLLLTVATCSNSFQKQLDMTHRMFSGRERFHISGSVPNGITNGEVENYLKKAAVEKAISAVKVHPNVSGLDLTLADGKERLECILAACSRLSFPLVIHTGRSSFVDAPWRNLGDVKNFQDINLNSSVPVVLAHAGAYDFPIREMETGIVPVLKRIMDKSSNVFVDVSALYPEKMEILFSNIGTDRIMFGSDALYENQCVMLSRLICTLEKVSKHPADDLVTTLCKNPGKYIFMENSLKERSGQ